MNDIEKRKYIFQLIKENAGVDEIVIREDMKLFEDLEYDSIRIITLISEIEEKFGFEFEDYDQLLEVVDNVGSFIDYFLSILK